MTLPKTRFQFLLILLLAISPTVAFSVVEGQSYVTQTTQVTSYVHSTVTLGYTTVTSTVTHSPVNIYSGTFTMNHTAGGGRRIGCYPEFVPFAAQQGQYVSGTFSSDHPVEFHVMTMQNYLGWTECDAAPPAIAGQMVTMEYSFNAMIPQTGD